MEIIIAQLSKVQLIAVRACLQEISLAQQRLAQAKAQFREVLEDLGLDPDHAYRVAPDGKVYEGQAPPADMISQANGALKDEE